ncbi:hypothetical protein A3Q56_00574 [Intoshia linei]|uniref:U6 snRNA phosphodiesterase 1 n=1 Tax=Intoshia linei TaxID=1819745 RepID=A0A177BBG6_9BILA|nr:hypothetical protein A3Q56_00574 [Intoshia linei]
MSTHEGRIRSFPHKIGDWAYSFYANVTDQVDEDYIKFVSDELLENLNSNYKIEFQKMSEFHVSFSFVSTIRNHWINDIYNEIASKLKNRKEFDIRLGEFDVFVNDELTRSFLIVKIYEMNHGQLQFITKNIYNVLEKYTCIENYQNKIHHISLAWCLGNIYETCPNISNYMDEFNNELYARQDDKYSDIDVYPMIKISNVYFKAGNVTLSLNLN